MNSPRFSPQTMRRFVETLSAGIGSDTYHGVLSNSGLSRDWRSPDFFLSMDSTEAAEAYAKLQSAMRTYYGRGARGILLRMGSNLWGALLDDASFAIKAQFALARGLPKTVRRKPALDLLAGRLGAARGDIKTHSQHPDLLFVDYASPTAQAQREDSPICFVTLGLIRECLHWATGEEHDIEERSCKAAGGRHCEFKITLGA